MQELSDHLNGILDRMNNLNAIRDVALVQGRQAIRSSANCVRALHRGDLELAESHLEEARKLVTELRQGTADHPTVALAGYAQDAMKEFAEAAITTSILRNTALPGPADLGVEDAAWLNAMAEAGSELRRDVLDLLRNGEAGRAVELLERMEDIYAGLVTIDFPDAITGGLRRTVDQFRAVLERTRGDLTISMQQRELKLAIDDLQNTLRSEVTREL